jgi:hypothetical protein
MKSGVLDENFTGKTEGVSRYVGRSGRMERYSDTSTWYEYEPMLLIHDDEKSL